MFFGKGLKMNNFYLTTGSGISHTYLNAFDRALVSARIGNYNLVKVSSILSPNSERRDIVGAMQGVPLFTAYATISSHEEQIIASAIGVGMPADKSSIGVIMEYSHVGSKESADSRVRKMVQQAMEDRKIEVREILSDSVSVEAHDDGLEYVALAAIAMW
jgi:arginine decarboxylase